jgi:hypothetical protein
MTKTDVLSTDVLSPRMFCPHGRLVPTDVLSAGRFVPMDLFSTDVLSVRTFVPTDILSTDVLSPDVLSPDVLPGHHYYLFQTLLESLRFESLLAPFLQQFKLILKSKISWFFTE